MGHRVFLAINPSVELLREVSEAQRQMRATCAGAGWEIKWVAPSNLNLLLWFFGEISTALTDPIEESLRPVGGAAAPFPLVARGVVIEGESARIVVPIEDPAGQLASLRQAIAAPLIELGFREPAADLAPRLVIGRVIAAPSKPKAEAEPETDADAEAKPETDADAEVQPPLAELLAPWRDRGFGEFTAGEVSLHRSQGVAPGEGYPRLWCVSLRGAQLPSPDPQSDGEAEPRGDEPDTQPEESLESRPDDPSGEETSRA